MYHITMTGSNTMVNLSKEELVEVTNALRNREAGARGPLPTHLAHLYFDFQDACQDVGILVGYDEGVNGNEKALGQS